MRPAEKPNAKLRAQLFGSGTILNEALKAQQILAEKYDVQADVWSATSYKELYMDAQDCERWNVLHPGQPERVPYVTKVLSDAPGPVIAASDYVKALPETISRWIPNELICLGTDGFGRSDNRGALRNFFEVDAKHIVVATLSGLFREGKIEANVVEKAIKELGVDVEKSKSGDTVKVLLYQVTPVVS